MVLTSSNTGSAASALNIVDYNEDVYVIREGQVKNYVWDDGSVPSTTSGLWVKQTSFVNISGEFTFVTQSGMEIWVDISGDVIRLYGDKSTSGAASGSQILNVIRMVNLSGVEPVIAQLTHAGDTSGQGIVVRTVNLSGVEPSIVRLTHAGDTSGQAITVRTVNMSGVEPAIVTIAHSGDTSGEAIAVRVANLSGTEPIVATVSGSITLLSGSITAIHSGTGPVFVTTMSGIGLELASGTSIVGTFYDYAADSSTLIPASFRVMNLSGAEPILVTVSGLTSGFGVIATIASTSGSIPVLVSGLTSGFGVSVNISGQAVVVNAGVSVNISGQAVVVNAPLSVYRAGASNAAVSAWLAVTDPVWFEHVTMHQDIAATTTGAVTITLISVSGAVYDTLLYSDTTLWQDFFYQPPNPVVLVSGEGIKVAYPNTDSKNIGVRIASRMA